MQRVTFSELFSNPLKLSQLFDGLRQGGILALPTDTLYGLATDGASSKGVEAIYRLKGREGHKPLILFLSEAGQLSNLSVSVDPRNQVMLQKHWPGALTAVFPFAGHPRLSAFPFSSLGIRVPAHPELIHFLKEYSGLLLTTSANRSNTPPLGSPDEIEQEMGTEIDWLIDAGPLPEGTPSTVADFSQVPPKVLRQGKVYLHL